LEHVVENLGNYYIWIFEELLDQLTFEICENILDFNQCCESEGFKVEIMYLLDNIWQLFIIKYNCLKSMIQHFGLRSQPITEDTKKVIEIILDFPIKSDRRNCSNVEELKDALFQNAIEKSVDLSICSNCACELDNAEIALIPVVFGKKNTTFWNLKCMEEKKSLKSLLVETYRAIFLFSAMEQSVGIN